MGAFDIYAAEAPCPRCQSMFRLRGQTKFFEPDINGLWHRHFEPGLAQPVTLSLTELTSTRVWSGDWWRVRERMEPHVLHLFIDFDEQRTCDCGAPLAGVLRFRLAQGEQDTATLERMLLFDALQDDVAGAVDFASGDHLFWLDNTQDYSADLVALAALPPPERAARLREALRQFFRSRLLD
jgi:hypothetical protein